MLKTWVNEEKKLSLQSEESSFVTSKVYNELADYPVVETDVIEQLKHNMALLEDLHGRLSFMMKEVRGVLKV